MSLARIAEARTTWGVTQTGMVTALVATTEIKMERLLP